RTARRCPTWTAPARTHTILASAARAARGRKPMSSGEETRNERLVRTFFETLSSGDLEALRPQIHVDGSWEATGKSIPGAGITRGRDKIIDELLAPVRGLFVPGDPKVKILRIFGKDEWVAAECEAHGTLANGKPYDNRYAWIFEIREYMDTGYILQQLAES